jgi:hypothetical protein
MSFAINMLGSAGLATPVGLDPIALALVSSPENGSGNPFEVLF